MVKVKFCGLSRVDDIMVVNRLAPEFVGFVFWERSKRCVDVARAALLRERLADGIQAVGVFLDETVENVAKVLESGVIDIAQLHGHEDEDYINRLRKLSGKPIIKAFNISDAGNSGKFSGISHDKDDNDRDDNAILCDIERANASSADFVLLDSKVAGSGNTFNWDFVKGIKRPYFLAGGLNLDNISDAIKLSPYAVDVSSGIETNGVKDKYKMEKFMEIVRGGNDVG